MNNLTADIGYKSINHYGEYLCGDTVQVVDGVNQSKVIVLADGLKSGVKASILSTLTARIISTMLGEGLTLEECINAVASTLPISSEHGLAYSTFSVMHLVGCSRARIIQYENPSIIMLRENEPYNFKTSPIQIADKTLLYSDIALEEGDTFIMMSDGCPGANSELKYNLDWQSSYRFSQSQATTRRLLQACLSMSVTGFMMESLSMTQRPASSRSRRDLRPIFCSDRLADRATSTLCSASSCQERVFT